MLLISGHAVTTAADFLLPPRRDRVGWLAPVREQLGGVAAPRRLIELTLQELRSTRQDLGDRATSVTHTGGGAGGDEGSDPAEPEQNFKPDSISMEQLVNDHADAVYRVALSVTRDPSLAEDASQDALIKAWQALPTFRGDAPLRNWVLRIAHNTAVSLLRRRRDEVRAPADLPERIAHEVSVETQVQQRLAIDRFEQALEQLDSTSRSIVVLREVEGLTYDEISDVLELPLPTVKTRLLRARRHLARALDGWQP